MYLGPFYFDTKELFLVLATILLGFALYFKWPLRFFQPDTLLTLTIIILLTKGLLKSVHNDVFFFHAIIAIVLALWLSTLQVILFYIISFAFLRLFRAI